MQHEALASSRVQEYNVFDRELLSRREAEMAELREHSLALAQAEVSRRDEELHGCQAQVGCCAGSSMPLASFLSEQKETACERRMMLRCQRSPNPAFGSHADGRPEARL